MAVSFKQTARRAVLGGVVVGVLGAGAYVAFVVGYALGLLSALGGLH